MTPGLTQSCTRSKAQRNPILCFYAAALQREIDTRSELANIIIPNSNKRTVLYCMGPLILKSFEMLVENKKQGKETTNNDNQSTLSN